MKEITAEQYRLLSALEGQPTEEQLIKIFFGKSKGNMTLKEIQALDFSGFKMPTPDVYTDLILHDGVLYGKQDMQELTFGLYIDLVDQAKNIQENLILIMAMLWRPVSKITYWNRTKAYIAHKLLNTKSLKLRATGLKIMAKVKYEIIPYDVMECTRREDKFKSLPGSVAAYATTFFLITSQQLALNSLRSLKDNLENQRQALVESLQKISQDGAGTPTSGSLQEKGPQE
jgi:hypothetical protein